jgi:hypothetical protein
MPAEPTDAPDAPLDVEAQARVVLHVLEPEGRGLAGLHADLADLGDERISAALRDLQAVGVLAVTPLDGVEPSPAVQRLDALDLVAF